MQNSNLIFFRWNISRRNISMMMMIKCQLNLCFSSSCASLHWLQSCHKQGHFLGQHWRQGQHWHRGRKSWCWECPWWSTPSASSGTSPPWTLQEGRSIRQTSSFSCCSVATDCIHPKSENVCRFWLLVSKNLQKKCINFDDQNWTLGIDFPIPPSFWRSTDTMQLKCDEKHNLMADFYN